MEMSGPFLSPTRPGGAASAGTGADRAAKHRGSCVFPAYLYETLQNMIDQHLDRCGVVMYLYKSLQNTTEVRASHGG
jgi:hypothetical protein